MTQPGANAPVPTGSPTTAAALRVRMVKRTALALIGIVGLLGGALYWMDWRNRQAADQRKEKSRAHVILRPTDEAQDWRVKEAARVEELAKQIERQAKEMKELSEQVDQLRGKQRSGQSGERRGRQQPPPPPPFETVPPLAQVFPPPAPAPAPTPSAPAAKPAGPPGSPPGADPQAEDTAPRITVPPKPRAAKSKAESPKPEEKPKPERAHAPQAPKLRVITPRAEPRASRAARGQTISPVGWLPSGSFIHAMLLSGVDAGTGTGSGLPYPVLMRLTDPAVLPNFAKMDLAECFVIGAAFGDLPSERVYIRTETLSCLRRSGALVTIDGELKGHAIGEDGKLGLRGRVVSKEGTLIARSLLAGFLSGLGQTFRPRITFAPTVLGQTDGQSFSLPPLGDTLQAAGISGVGRSMEMLAQYYVKQAQNLFPVIEINSGRQVDLVVLKGMPLKFTIRRAAAREAEASPAPD